MHSHTCRSLPVLQPVHMCRQGTRPTMPLAARQSEAHARLWVRGEAPWLGVRSTKVHSAQRRLRVAPQLEHPWAARHSSSTQCTWRCTSKQVHVTLSSSSPVLAPLPYLLCLIRPCALLLVASCALSPFPPALPTRLRAYPPTRPDALSGPSSRPPPALRHRLLARTPHPCMHGACRQT
jgi:hypothetical protein